MAVKQFLFILLVSLQIFHCSKASLLQETLAKAEAKLENDDELKVEVVNDEKSNDNEAKDGKGTNSKESEDKEDADSEREATIHLETIYKPVECNDVMKSGKVAVMHYTGWIGDKKFDSTIDPLKKYMPFEFIVGTGSVIKGFEQGIKDMCKGEQRKITIPPELGYGEKGAGLIPGNATITYDVQLLDIREPPPQADVFGAMDGDGDKKLSREEVAEYMKKQAQMHYGAPMDDYYWSQYHNQMVDNIFAQDDEDEDGHISHDEFSGPKIHHEEL